MSVVDPQEKHLAEAVIIFLSDTWLKSSSSVRVEI